VLLRRLSADPTPRPLLSSSDPAARLRALLQERLPLYGQADLRISQGDGTPDQVAAQVLESLPSVLKSPETTPPQPVILQNAEGQTLSSLN
jgi:shikimate kinase